jgi:hypothetical protein
VTVTGPCHGYPLAGRRPGAGVDVFKQCQIRHDDASKLQAADAEKGDRSSNAVTVLPSLAISESTVTRHCGRQVWAAGMVSSR